MEIPVHFGSIRDGFFQLQQILPREVDALTVADAAIETHPVHRSQSVFGDDHGQTKMLVRPVRPPTQSRGRHWPIEASDGMTHSVRHMFRLTVRTSFHHPTLVDVESHKIDGLLDGVEVGVRELGHVLGVGLQAGLWIMPQACRLKPPRVVEVVAKLHTLLHLLSCGVIFWRIGGRDRGLTHRGNADAAGLAA